MTARQVTHVVVAAGGLGTRVRQWSQFLPKEFYPVDGRPGIVHLLTEIAALQPVQVAIVYHPYYEPFIQWAKHVLQPGSLARYQASSREASFPERAIPEMDLEFIAQRGPYADVTSILNGADHLPRGPLLLAFADNLYCGATPLLDLTAATPDTVAVLARPFNLSESEHRGVIICGRAGSQVVMSDLVEKPGAAQVADLVGRHGPDNLRLLEGRAHLTTDFIDYLRTAQPHTAHTEPKLSQTLAHYSHRRRVEVITTTTPVTDLGAPSSPSLAFAGGPCTTRLPGSLGDGLPDSSSPREVAAR